MALGMTSLYAGMLGSWRLSPCLPWHGMDPDCLYTPGRPGPSQGFTLSVIELAYPALARSGNV